MIRFFCWRMSPRKPQHHGVGEIIRLFERINLRGTTVVLATHNGLCRVAEEKIVLEQENCWRPVSAPMAGV
jgi:hypothetical protein